MSYLDQMWSKWNDDEEEYNDLKGEAVKNDYVEERQKRTFKEEQLETERNSK